MKNVTNTNQSKYNGILEARVFFKNIKVVEVEKGENYCSICASIVDIDSDGNRSYETIDLIVKGEENKQIMRDFRDKWAKWDNEHTWVADVRIGSVYAKAYTNKDGKPDGVLKGRLIKIRALKINDNVVLGDSEIETLGFPVPTFVSPCYINDINLEKKYAYCSLVDGKKEKPSYESISLELIEEFDELRTLDEEGNCPRGYKHKETNPKVFAVFEMRHLGIKAYSDKNTQKPKASLKAQLTGIRYLSVKPKYLADKDQNPEVNTPVLIGKSKPRDFAESSVF